MGRNFPCPAPSGRDSLDMLICDFRLEDARHLPMAKDDVGKELQAKGLELKNFFKDLHAVLEEWKFSVEETKEGTRIEVHAVALVQHHKN
jgi:hypothetical protein